MCGATDQEPNKPGIPYGTTSLCALPFFLLRISTLIVSFTAGHALCSFGPVNYDGICQKKNQTKCIYFWLVFYLFLFYNDSFFSLRDLPLSVQISGKDVSPVPGKRGQRTEGTEQRHERKRKHNELEREHGGKIWTGM